MEIQKSEVIALKITELLLREFHYRIVLVKDDERNIWLANPDHPSYGLVKISNMSASDSFFNREYIDQIKDGLGSILQEKVQLLEVYTNDSIGEDSRESDYDVWCIAEEKNNIPEFIESAYPSINQVLKEITDPKKEYIQLTSKIRQWQIKQLASAKAQAFKKVPLVTYGIMALCIFVYLLSMLLRSFSADEVAIAVVLGAYYKAFLWGMNEYWRLLTSGFVHVEIWHLLMNTISIYSIGSFLEPRIGKRTYSIVLLLSILSGNLFVAFGAANTVAFGLSGGLYGLCGFLVILFYQSGVFGNPRMLRQFITVGAINLAISFMPGISWLGHLGGFIAGLLLGGVFLVSQNRLLRNNCLISGIILFLVLSFLSYNNRKLDMVYRLTDQRVSDIYQKIGFTNYAKKIDQQMEEYYGGQ